MLLLLSAALTAELDPETQPHVPAYGQPSDLEMHFVFIYFP